MHIHLKASSSDPDSPDYDISGDVDLAAQTVTVRLTADSGLPFYTISGRVEIGAGILSLKAVPAHADFPGYEISGLVDLRAGTVSLGVTALEAGFPDYEVSGYIDHREWTISLGATSSGNKFPDYEIFSHINPTMATVSIGITASDEDFPSYEVYGAYERTSAEAPTQAVPENTFPSSTGFPESVSRHGSLSRSQADGTHVANREGKDRFQNIRGLPDVQNLHHTEFERYVGYLFRQMGYEVEYTPGSGDEGVDLFAYKEDGQRVIVQCKQWNQTTGAKEVRNLIGAMTVQRATKAYFVTTSTFSSQAFREASRVPALHLIDRNRLAEWIRLYGSPSVLQDAYRAQAAPKGIPSSPPASPASSNAAPKASVFNVRRVFFSLVTLAAVVMVGASVIQISPGVSPPAASTTNLPGTSPGESDIALRNSPANKPTARSGLERTPVPSTTALKAKARRLLDAGREALAANQPGEALVLLEEAQQLDPNNPDVLIALGDAHHHAGEFKTSIEVYNEALRLQPNNAQILYAIGRSYGQLGQYVDAVNYYDRASNADPNFAPVYFGYGLALKETGQQDQAVTMLRKYVSISHSTPDRQLAQRWLVEILCADPDVRITKPGIGDTVSGQVKIVGTAGIRVPSGFQFYKVEYSRESEFISIGDVVSRPARDQVLASWSTELLPAGEYTIRLTAVDKTGNYPPPCDVNIVLR